MFVFRSTINFFNYSMLAGHLIPALRRQEAGRSLSLGHLGLLSEFQDSYTEKCCVKKKVLNNSQCLAINF